MRFKQPTATTLRYIPRATTNVRNFCKMLVIVSILIVSYGHVTKASPVCTEEKLNECYDLLNKDGLPSATVLYFSEEVMTEHCRRYRIFSECLKTISPYCTDSMVNVSIRVYQGIDDSFNFACGDGFKDYVKLQSQCFKYDEIQTEAKSCSDTFTSRTNNLNLNATNKKDIRVRYCMYVDDYIDCVYNMLRSFCGDEAANWQKTFDTKSIQPSMVAFQCNGWPATTTSPATNGSTGSIWVISLGVAIVLTGIMVALGLTVLICSKCRCRKRFSRRSTTTTSFDMPPPYSGPPFTICRSSDSHSSASVATATTDSSLRHGDAGVAKGTVVKTTDADVSPAAAAAEIRRARDGGGIGSTTTTTTTRGVDAQRSVSVFEDGSADETTGAVGGGSGVGVSPFARAFTPPHGHFELPSPGSSILSYLPSSSDDDTSSLISHTCDYY